MQQEKMARRSNRDRSEETRGKLLSAARALFVEKGYAETGTPEIVKSAEVTRGALYHHFSDKADLFRAVVIQEAHAVADEIEEASIDQTDPIDALVTGAEAYFQAMRHPGRSRILLIDGPAVLGADALAAIDRESGGGTLYDGLAYAALRFGRDDLPVEELASLLSASFYRAALAVSEGADPAVYAGAMRQMLLGLFR